MGRRRRPAAEAGGAFRPPPAPIQLDPRPSRSRLLPSATFGDMHLRWSRRPAILAVGGVCSPPAAIRPDPEPPPHPHRFPACGSDMHSLRLPALSRLHRVPRRLHLLLHLPSLASAYSLAFASASSSASASIPDSVSPIVSAGFPGRSQSAAAFKAVLMRPHGHMARPFQWLTVVAWSVAVCYRLTMHVKSVLLDVDLTSFLAMICLLESGVQGRLKREAPICLEYSLGDIVFGDTVIVLGRDALPPFGVLLLHLGGGELLGSSTVLVSMLMIGDEMLMIGFEFCDWVCEDGFAPASALRRFVVLAGPGLVMELSGDVRELSAVGDARWVPALVIDGSGSDVTAVGSPPSPAGRGDLMDVWVPPLVTACILFSSRFSLMVWASGVPDPAFRSLGVWDVSAGGCLAVCSALEMTDLGLFGLISLVVGGARGLLVIWFADSFSSGADGASLPISSGQGVLLDVGMLPLVTACSVFSGRSSRLVWNWCDDGFLVGFFRASVSGGWRSWSRLHAAFIRRRYASWLSGPGDWAVSAVTQVLELLLWVRVIGFDPG